MSRIARQPTGSRRVNAMTRSAGSLLLLMLATAVGGIIESAVCAVAREEDAPARVVLPQVSDPNASQAVVPDVEAESNPKNIVHLLPSPVAKKSAPKRNDDRHTQAQPDKSPSSYAPDSTGKTAVFSDTSARSMTPQDLVHERAAQRDMERRRRIEGRRWVGYEPSRPAVSAIPFMSGTNWQPMVVVVPRMVPDYRRN